MRQNFPAWLYDFPTSPKSNRSGQNFPLDLITPYPRVKTIREGVPSSKVAIDFIYLVVSCLCFVSTVRSQLPQQETYDYCDPKLELCEVFTDHVMCKYPFPGLRSECGTNTQEPLSATEKKRILFWHNKFRSNVANGTEKNKTRKLPTSSNMRQIYWDPELETLAERWANQCTSTKDSKMYDDCRNTKRFQVSQNVGTRQVNASTIDKQGPQIVITWYKGSKDFDPSLVEKFAPIAESGVSTKQFVNIIRGDTYAIGCARIIFHEQNKGDKSVWTIERLVCNYGPGGNQYGKPLYKRGVPCSDCPPGTQCSRVFPGLCAIQNADKPEGEQTVENEMEKEAPKKISTPVSQKISKEGTPEDEQDYRFFSPTPPEIREESHKVGDDEEEDEEWDCEGEKCLTKTPMAPLDTRRRFDDIIRVAKPTARKKSREVGTGAPSQMDDIYSEKRKWIVSNDGKVRREEKPLKNGDKCYCYQDVQKLHMRDSASHIHPFIFIIFFSSFTFYLL